MSSFAPLARAFEAHGVRYLLIGVAGANMHAHRAGVVFATQDRDVFLPPDPENLVAAWRACEECELELTASGQPLDIPRDGFLAGKVIERRALTQAMDDDDLQVDLTLVMAGFEFEVAWAQHRSFKLSGEDVPVASLHHIIASKAAAGRDKDRLFLATHEENLRQLLPPEQD